jgi:two-component system, response regulator
VGAANNEVIMDFRTILLAEDNPDDEALALRPLQKGNLANDVVVVRDGQEVLDYMFGSGSYAGRDVSRLPAIVLLDLKLPKFDGLEVLRRLRADERTRLTRVVIFTSSREERDVVEGYRLGANGYIRKPVDFVQSTEAVEHLGLYWVLLNEPPPL